MTRLPTSALFAVCVLVWGTTWYAITYQIGVLPPAIGVALRFGLGGVAVLAWCLWRSQPMRFGWPGHAWLALQGSLLFGVSYVCVYHAEKHLPSGLVSVGYSASPIVSGLGAWWLFRGHLSARFLAGGALGIAGVALIFWPEFGGVRDARETTIGAAFTAGSVLLSTAGSLAASRNALRGLPFWPSLGWGMVYGSLTGACVALITGETFGGPVTLAWWLSLFYLAFVGSVLCFACFLTIQQRLGPGPAGTIGVMTPLVALVVSALFEAWRPDALSLVGAALAVAGNALMLRRG
jgi:drug/metabolite transporter (DMT)-like permease